MENDEWEEIPFESICVNDEVRYGKSRMSYLVSSVENSAVKVSHYISGTSIKEWNVPEDFPLLPNIQRKLQFKPYVPSQEGDRDDDV